MACLKWLSKDSCYNHWHPCMQISALLLHPFSICLQNTCIQLSSNRFAVSVPSVAVPIQRQIVT